jgi:hypothetical protein
MTQQKRFKLIENLWHSCRSTNDWNPDFEQQVVYSAVTALFEDKRFQKKWDDEIVYYGLLDALSNRADLKKLTESDIISIIDDAWSYVSKAAADHWIVIPLNYADLDEDIFFRQFKLITGTQEEMIEKLATITRQSRRELIDRASHIVNTRSEDFFEHPLIIFKLNNQTAEVRRIAQPYAKLIVNILQVIYHGRVSRAKHSSSVFIRRRNAQPSAHLMILASGDWRWGPRPLGFDYTLHMKLGWLKNKTYQSEFRQLFNLMKIIPRDELQLRFFRSMHFFSKALQSEFEKGNSDGIGMPITFLMIATECLFEDRRGEISSRLISIVPKLVNLTSVSDRKIAQAMQYGYKRRCDFVHAGIDTFESWKPDMSPGEEREYHELLKRSIANILCNASNYHRQARQKNPENPAKAWFLKLNEIWKSQLGLR